MPSTPTSTRAANPRSLRFALGLLVVATTGLIVLGALVRAHDAGLACPDWPRCFGSWIPEMDLRVAFEWSHRAIAGGIALAFGALAFWIWRAPAPLTRARPWLCLGAALLALQVVLGGLTVLLRLAPWTVTAHLLTGNSFNATLLVLALSLADLPSATPLLRPSARRLLFIFAGTLVLQLGLGGALSSQYAGLACPEWPTCNGGAWFPSFRGSVGLHLAHRMNGYLLLALGAWLFAVAGAWRSGRTAFAIPLALVLLQVGVGVANVMMGLPVEVTALHSALAALLVLATTRLCYTQTRDATL